MNKTDANKLIRLNVSEPYQRALSITPEFAATKRQTKWKISMAQQNLDRELTGALRKYQSSTDGGRRGVRMALAATRKFFAATAPQCADKFDLINMVLVAALCDLDRGVVAPLVKKIGHGREKDSFAHRGVQIGRRRQWHA
jgi:hypothetical protein